MVAFYQIPRKELMEDLPVDRMIIAFFAIIIAFVGISIACSGVNTVTMHGDWFAGIAWTLLGVTVTLVSLGYVATMRK
jgi:hypothetical protein